MNFTLTIAFVLLDRFLRECNGYATVLKQLVSLLIEAKGERAGMSVSPPPFVRH